MRGVRHSVLRGTLCPAVCPKYLVSPGPCATRPIQHLSSNICKANGTLWAAHPRGSFAAAASVSATAARLQACVVPCEPVGVQHASRQLQITCVPSCGRDRGPAWSNHRNSNSNNIKKYVLQELIFGMKHARCTRRCHSTTLTRPHMCMWRAPAAACRPLQRLIGDTSTSTHSPRSTAATSSAGAHQVRWVFATSVQT